MSPVLTWKKLPAFNLKIKVILKGIKSTILLLIIGARKGNWQFAMSLALRPTLKLSTLSVFIRLIFRLETITFA